MSSAALESEVIYQCVQSWYEAALKDVACIARALPVEQGDAPTEVGGRTNGAASTKGAGASKGFLDRDAAGETETVAMVAAARNSSSSPSKLPAVAEETDEAANMLELPVVPEETDEAANVHDMSRGGPAPSDGVQPTVGAAEPQALQHVS